MAAGYCVVAVYHFQVYMGGIALIKLLIVDDHLLLREGIKYILGAYDNLQIAAEAYDGEDALRVLKTNKFDIILSDINMPKINGIELIRRVKGINKNAKCIVLSAYADEGFVTAAFEAGAKGYVLKSASPETIVDAIRHVRSGGYYFHTAMPKRLQKVAANTVASLNKPLELPPPEQDSVQAAERPKRKPRTKLTLREVELMSLIAQGLRNRDIASQLRLSEKTIKNHLTSVFRKLGVEDRTQALCVAVQKKIVLMR